jgi:hypothetical protein
VKQNQYLAYFDPSVHSAYQVHHFGLLDTDHSNWMTQTPVADPTNIKYILINSN